MTDGERKKFDGARWTLIFLILAVSAGTVMYKLTVREHLEQTSLLFVGIPAILAIILALTPKAKTALGAILKGLTVALLLSAPLLGEGFICIVMASPIFYGVGILIGVLVDENRKYRQTTLSCLVLVLLPMSIEGGSPVLSFNREETVQASRIINASAEQVELAISRSPHTDLPLPLYLRMGFPRPTEAKGEGLQVGAPRSIRFAGGETRPSDLHLIPEQRALRRARSGDVAHGPPPRIDASQQRVERCARTRNGSRVAQRLRRVQNRSDHIRVAVGEHGSIGRAADGDGEAPGHVARRLAIARLPRDRPRRHEIPQQAGAYELTRHQRLDRGEVLLGQRLGRRHHRRLKVVLDRAQHRVERDHGLA